MDQLDPQTLRLVLAVIGALIIAGVYIWGRHKEKVLDFILQRGEYDELGLDEKPKAKPKQAPTPKSPVKEEPTMNFEGVDEEGMFDWGGEAKPDPVLNETVQRAPAEETGRTTSLGAPFLIQISIVSTDDYFDGIQLRDALEDCRLIYGDMGIYHRYDRDLRVPLFSVASLVEPGTFPITEMEEFYCPGIVLFYQPSQVDDPITVFDDLVVTCHELAVSLGGEEWDEKRQPLTQEKILRMRSRLREAY